MVKSVIEEYPNTDISINIVWAAMLGSDDQSAARGSSRLFTDPRVRQFWDPNRRTGIAYAGKVFPNMVKDMASSIPDDEPMLQGLKDRRDTPSEKMPLWDVAFFYDKGTVWKNDPPTPKDWAKQVLFYAGGSDGNTGKFWRGDFAKAPFDTDWFVELSKGMERLTGKKPTRAGRANAQEGDKVSTRGKEGPNVVSLEGSLDPVKDHFNANRGKHRFVTLLSPT